MGIVSQKKFPVKTQEKKCKDYKNCFDAEGNENDKESKQGDSFAKRWGWWSLIDNLSNSRADKWNYFIEMNVIEVLNMCCYFKEKQEMEAQMHRDAMQKIKRHG